MTLSPWSNALDVLGANDQVRSDHYNWHRYYDPSIGRYISADPIGQVGGINVFQYASNNPENEIDPYGLFGFNDIPNVPSSVSNFAAGFGDTLSGGLSALARDAVGELLFGDEGGDGEDGGAKNLVDPCSSAYGNGELAAYAHAAASGAAAAARAAGWTASFGTFEHGGFGLSVSKNGALRFGAHHNPFKLNGVTKSRPHLHYGKTKSQVKKHRPWQGGW